MVCAKESENEHIALKEASDPKNAVQSPHTYTHDAPKFCWPPSPASFPYFRLLFTFDDLFEL